MSEATTQNNYCWYCGEYTPHTDGVCDFCSEPLNGRIFKEGSEKHG